MALPGVSTKTVKTYSISQSFGTETRELEYSTVVRYNNNNQILDSALYAHNIPLKKNILTLADLIEGLDYYGHITDSC